VRELVQLSRRFYLANVRELVQLSRRFYLANVRELVQLSRRFYLANVRELVQLSRPKRYLGPCYLTNTVEVVKVVEVVEVTTFFYPHSPSDSEQVAKNKAIWESLDADL
jgi:hypothetical protein